MTAYEHLRKPSQFYYQIRKDVVTARNVEYYIKEGLKRGRSPTEIVRTLRDLGLSYRYAEMLYDIGKHAISIHAKTPLTAQKAWAWYDYVFEPLRKEYGMTRERFLEFYSRARRGVLMTPEEARLWDQVSVRLAELEEMGYGL